MLHLPDITLVVLAGNHVAASSAAMEDVFQRFAFEDVLVFRDTPETPFRSVEDATRIMWRGLLPRLTTTHAVTMHWDGYPVNPNQWDDGFRRYDFIGAVWPWFTENQIGNSGFSLQSRKFLEAIADLPMEQPEDIVLCRRQRPLLEARGVGFAPEDIADRFSVEHGPAAVPLGFHGVWNMLYFMDDDTIKARLLLMERSQWEKQQIDTLGYRAVIAGRRELYRWINRTRGELLGAKR
jgi:Protein of unknown function (DUF5672)